MEEQIRARAITLGTQDGLSNARSEPWRNVDIPTVTYQVHDSVVKGCRMDLRRAAAAFAIIVGAMMFAQWAFFIAAGEVPELETEPIRISFHLAAEFLTATALVVAGLGLVKGESWSFPVLMLALGMLSYTIIVSPGYFAQDGEYLFVAMFVALWILTSALVFVALRREAEFRKFLNEEDDPGA